MPICDVHALAGTASVAASAAAPVSDGKLKFLAGFDFSTLGTQSLSTDGSQSVATCVGSLVQSLTVVTKNMANNVGGVFDIASGKLTITAPTTNTSTFGQYYWSTLHSPLIAIDMRQFAEVLADVNMQKWDIVMDIEHESIFSTPNGPVITTANVELNTGFTVGLSTYLSSGTVPTRWYFSRLRSDAQGASTVDGTYWYGMNNRSTTIQTGGPSTNLFKTSQAPFGSLYTTGATKTRVVYNSYMPYVSYGTSTLTDGYRYYNFSQMNGSAVDEFQWNTNNNGSVNLGAFRLGNTNDIWATISPQRTSGSGSTNFKISKIMFYLAEKP